MECPGRGVEHRVWCGVRLDFACMVFECLGIYNMCVVEARFVDALVSVPLVMLPLAKGSRVLIGGVWLVWCYGGDCRS